MAVAVGVGVAVAVGVTVAVAVEVGVAVAVAVGVDVGAGLAVGVGLGADPVIARSAPEADAPKPFAVQAAVKPVSVGGPDPSQVNSGRFAPTMCKRQLLGSLLPVTFTGS